ncbi:LEAF RUST 10 DISEASE-RESISTANCE LOCUS RECEPTOR-LIKE PROTEIN KINASE-like 2.4 [Lotus japonicus]|uniref:LEAF RUST 10 DISEASE-RESISTANCE LOCUS RECEPTOR-LIKE PROTEIN KINASE-like 2.4 n=1 Tax=Lotus japonicus TaxID=34305 RepID=UPI002589F516|nr:LEAF RUST 10 DISEASE-RESISTANCE LOCUS RECEPTOR-LIKE PROTEIN KINASE-like 2.4 [Lotus japonicus]
MNSLLILLPPISILQLTLLLILIHTPLPSTSNDYYRDCNNLFSCGDIRNIGFPFWGKNRPNGCGHPLLHLTCEENPSYMNLNDVRYKVLEAKPDEKSLRVTRVDYLQELCPSIFVNTSLDPKLFVLESQYQNLTLFYDCVVPNAVPFPCVPNSGSGQHVYAQLGSFDFTSMFCKQSVVVPVPKVFVDITDVNKTLSAIRNGFVVNWIAGIQECEECRKAGGVCGYDSIRPTCYCRERDQTCPEELPSSGSYSSQWSTRRKIVIGVAASCVGGLITIISIAIYIRRKFKSLSGQTMISRKRSTFVEHDVEAFMQSYGSLAPRRYSYSEVKRITNSFVHKVGQGGYGVVYKATLPDGRLVAVKVISESDGSGEDFINEVSSISRTSHVNIVSLLGFCYDRNKRALIYEFMPNGSLDNFINGMGSPNAISCFDWNTLYEVAIGIARGLEYLHRGCNTRILHLDIKPQNILLDEDLCPKIADFGLAKICKRKESIVSMLGTRGTPGYIAPEVFSRAFGGVSHKSDVYSYGMLILEMVGGRKNYDSGGGSQSSEMYFPDWIYKDLEQGDVHTNCLVITEEEHEMARKMILVSLWCIQTRSSERPSMSKVVEMLEGTLQSVPYPPKPILYSPEKLSLHISDISSDNTLETNSMSMQKDGSIEIELNELSKNVPGL